MINICKSSDYPNIYDKDILRDMNLIIKFLEQHIDLKDKNILDIGCGNGNFSLLIANKVKSIVAIDSSKSMLEELNHIASKENISNIKTYHCSFDKFHCDTKFDLVIGLFTPTIKSNIDLEKLYSLSNQGVLYGRFSKNNIDICEDIKKQYGIENTNHKSEIEIKEYKYISFPTTYTNTFFYENIFSICKNKVDTSDANLKKILDKYKDNQNMVKATITAIKELYFITSS